MGKNQYIGKKAVGFHLAPDCANGVARVAKELGLSMSCVIERLIIDAGLAKRFYQPNRWGEIVEIPASIAVHVPDSINLKKQILLAKYEKEMTFTAIKDMNRHLAELDSFIAEKVQEIGKSESFEKSEKRGLLPQKGE